MPFYLAWIYANFSRWNFEFLSISDLSYGTNQDFISFIQAQFFVAQYPQKLHSGRNKIHIHGNWQLRKYLGHFGMSKNRKGMNKLGIVSKWTVIARIASDHILWPHENRADVKVIILHTHQRAWLLSTKIYPS